MQEWDYEKNNKLNLFPQKLGEHSSKAVWWRCPQGHEYDMRITQRTRGQGCPYCSNNRVLAGFNDLATTNPKLANEWNVEKNGLLTPEKVTAHSNQVVWWKCSLGHEWRTAINHRSSGSGCPRCDQGKQTSFPEQAVFYYVSQKYPDAVGVFRFLC